ncbi:MAG: MATE family efflux transporter [Bacteroidia bacterium]|nr:MATE family efflux transporter [Bacteroidia bacterium]MCO5253995.1 MATE family efflux transporter [Bacteroidota bacterium]
MSRIEEAKRTTLLAIPIILGELVQMALHIIDAAMVGAVGYKQLAASSLVFSIINIPFVFGIGLTISIAQMVSMFKGQFDSQKVSHFFFNGMVISVIAAVIISVGLYFGSNIVFHLKQDPEVAALAQPFLKIMSISMIPMILFIACKQFADGLEYTKVAMVISLAGIPINIFINWLLIFGNWGFPRLELMGAGWGTLITRFLMLAAIVIDIFNSRLFKKYIKVIKRQWYVSFHAMRQLLHLGIPIALQIVLEASAFAISSILVGMISAESQAAHQIALSVASFTYMGTVGLAQACSIRISNAFGQSNWRKIRIIGKSTLIITVLTGFVCALAFILFRNQIPLFFNNSPEVVQIASWLLVLAALFQIPDATQVVAAGALRGIRDVKMPTLLIGGSYWLLGMPLGIYLAFKHGMDASGIWIGFIVALSLVSANLVSRFLKKTRVDD